jgi:hypothetical protein
MAQNEIRKPQARVARIEREIERERNEHSMNQDAKAHLGIEDDERHKDARETTFSSKVKR